MNETSFTVKRIPDMTSLIAGTADITELRDIDIIDLLGRDPADPDQHLLGKTLKNKTVLVTGAGGSIGSELCRQIAQQMPNHLVLLDISEYAIYELLQEIDALHPSLAITPLIGSVQDQNFVAKVLDQFQIDTVYHAAAYKHVPLMEQNVMQCIANNVFGTRIMANHPLPQRLSTLSSCLQTRRSTRQILWVRLNDLLNWFANIMQPRKVKRDLRLFVLAMF